MVGATLSMTRSLLMIGDNQVAVLLQLLRLTLALGCGVLLAYFDSFDWLCSPDEPQRAVTEAIFEVFNSVATVLDSYSFSLSLAFRLSYLCVW